MNRRQFSKNTLMASALISAASMPGFSNLMTPSARTLKKGIMWGSIGCGEDNNGEISGCKRGRF